MSNLVISELNIYPVKSLAGISLESTYVEPRGLRHDRRWMVVNEQGEFLTQRKLPQMVLNQVRVTDSGLELIHPNMPDLCVKEPGDVERIKVKVWDDVLDALPAGGGADAWLSETIGQRCRLVLFPEDHLRQVDEQYAHKGDQTAFSDGFPLLLISQASLDDLNSRLATPVSMNRFRPNIVISGTTAFEEDGWKTLSIGDVVLRVAKPCSRCVMTTVNPTQGIKAGPEPLRTLTTYRRQGNKVMFGQNVIPDTQGKLHIGDQVTVID